MAVKINKGAAKKKKTTATSHEGQKLSAKLADGTAVEQATGVAIVKSKEGGEKIVSEEIGAVTGQGPFANIGIRASRTINLGNYNSVKIEVSAYLPCGMSEEDLNDTFEFGKEWVDLKMSALTDEYGPADQKGE